MGNRTDRDDEWWRKGFESGDPMFRWVRHLYRAMPASPRCDLCFAPFAGLGGRVLRIAGYAPSRKNPRWCRRCFEEAPLGGVETEVAVLFADVRGYTSLGEKMPPDQLAALMNRYYAVATDILSRHDAVIDKLVGDQVVALFIPALATRGHLAECAHSAELLLRGVGYDTPEGPWLPLGIGIDAGVAFVGNVGSGEVKDFTAIGDVMNTASRLQSQAEGGQIVLSQRVYDAVAERFPGARPVELELKGKDEPVAARVVDFARAVAS